MSSNCEVEPGAASESVFITTDTSDNYEQMSSSLEEIKNSIICNEEDTTIKENFDDSNELDVDDNDDYAMNANWISKHKHIFVLSSAGKPIYSR